MRCSPIAKSFRRYAAVSNHGCIDVKPLALRIRPLAFTLIELLVVVSIISLLISIMLPSLSRARDQAKSVHCLARLKEFGHALAAYENVNYDMLPPAMWAKLMPEDPPPVLANYGWAETLWTYVYKEEIRATEYFPAMRNIDPEQYENYFICRASKKRGFNSGHYRVYLPAWAAGTFTILPDGTFGDDTRPDPWSSTTRSTIKPKMPLMGDANEHSIAGNTRVAFNKD